MLNDLQIKNIKKTSHVLFSTTSADGWPRVICVVPSRVEKNRIILSNIQMHKSFENLKQNNKSFINVYLPEQNDLQYKIKCKTDIQSEGVLFDDIKQYEENNNLPPELKVSAIIICTIVSIEESNG